MVEVKFPPFHQCRPNTFLWHTGAVAPDLAMHRTMVETNRQARIIPTFATVQTSGVSKERDLFAPMLHPNSVHKSNSHEFGTWASAHWKFVSHVPKQTASTCSHVHSVSPMPQAPIKSTGSYPSANQTVSKPVWFQVLAPHFMNMGIPQVTNNTFVKWLRPHQLRLQATWKIFCWELVWNMAFQGGKGLLLLHPNICNICVLHADKQCNNICGKIWVCRSDKFIGKNWDSGNQIN